ncbi:MAG: single-stranded-DNA-specific exonuclease RecJ [Cyanobacteria bacterium P01_A01_bin.123]
MYPEAPEAVQDLVATTGLSPLLAQVLVNRGIDQTPAAVEFMEPEQLQLPSPLEDFPDLPMALELLVNTIATQQKIAICGDYDADGMTSTALLLRALRFLGARVDYAIPSRMQEGYGINTRIVEDFHRDGVGLILTVDNGIAAFDPIARARELGLAVIVTDHHDVPPRIPPANAILNPKLIRPESPYRGVAGVGVAYILAICLAQALRRTQDLTAPLLELFTLGTIADLAPLTGVNRRWVRRGLGLLPRSRLPGIQALIQVAGLSNQQGELKPEAIGFRLGPRINAVGRIADPQIVIDMLTTDDVGVALQRAMQCEEANQMRQAMCSQIEEAAIAWCEAEQAAGRLDLVETRVLVLVQPDWHHGVIGIVASRLVERYGVPVFIGTYEDKDQKEIRGSARSIPEFNVFDALQSCHDLMNKFGGHRAAGGFSFPAKNLRQVKSRLSNFARKQLELEHLKPLITVDVQANLAQLTLDLYTQIDRLHPCGIDNPDPVFWTPNVRILEQQTVGKTRSHLKLTLGQAAHGGGSLAATMKAIAWRWGDYYPLPNQVDIAYKLKLNEWKGERNVELELIGVKEPTQQKPPRPLLKVAEPVAEPDIPKVNSSDSETPTSPQPLLANSTPPPLPSTSLRASPHSPTPPPTTGQLLTRAEFYYSKRRYGCATYQTQQGRELTIQNTGGDRITVQLATRQGTLHTPNGDSRSVDLADPFYFNLLRAGLSALELHQKTQLLLEKDELLSEKDSQIETLTQQVALLKQKNNQLSTEQQQAYQSLQSDLQQQTSAIQDQEAHIATLQSQLSESAAQIDPKAIKRAVRQALGDRVWYCLQSASQKDCYRAYKQAELLRLGGGNVDLADFSEAGLHLGFVVEREVIQPFFESLYDFSLTHSGPEVGGLSLSPAKKYTLGMLPPLLADQWRSLKDSALKSIKPVGGKQLYGQVGGNGGDRDLIDQFLQQWEHPLADWMAQSALEAASQVDQVSKLHIIAIQSAQVLKSWHYDLLRDLVVGDTESPGLFHQLYGQ